MFARFSNKLSKVRRAARQQLLVVDIFECEPTAKMDIPDDLIGRPGKTRFVSPVFGRHFGFSDELCRYIIYLNQGLFRFCRTLGIQDPCFSCDRPDSLFDVS